MTAPGGGRLAVDSALFAAGCLASFAATMTFGVILADESYLLQVAHRMVSGEILYRDVFLGVPPLSVYLLGALVAAVGPHILASKALAAVLYGAITLVCGRIDVRLGGGRWPAPVVVALLLASAVPLGLYATAATLFQLSSMAATLAWRAGARRGLELAGIAAGLSFGAKHTTGALTLAAVVACAMAGRPDRGGRRTTRLVSLMVSFGAAATVVLAPVVFSGGLPGLIEYGVLAKGSYLELAGAGYLASTRQVWHLISSLEAPGGAVWMLPMLIPPAALALGVVALGGSRGEGRARLAIAALFVAIGLAGAYPRFDVTHVAQAAPAGVLALACASRTLLARRGPPPRGIGLSLHAAAALIVAVMIAFIGGRWSRPHLAASRLGRFEGPLMDAAFADRARDFADRLAAAAPRGRVFHLSRRAAFRYLHTRAENPLPYDYPLATALGRHGLREVQEAVASGAVAAVCVDHDLARSGPLRPAALEEWVRSALVLGPDLGECTLYLAPAPRVQERRESAARAAQ